MARGEVRYRLALDTSAFADGIKKAKQEAVSLGNDMADKLGKAGSVLSAMGPAGAAAAVGIGAMATAAAVAINTAVDLTTAAAEAADNLSALQTKTGLTVETLQKMELAAKLGNTSLESLAAAANKVQRGIAAGNEDFEQLGLSLDELRKMSPDEQLREVAVALKGISDPVRRSAAEFAILGKSGNEIRGGLDALTSSASDLGGALRSDMVEGSAALADQLDVLDTAVERFKLQLGATIASSPELVQSIGDIAQSVGDLAETIAQNREEFGFLLKVLAAVTGAGGYLEIPKIISSVRRQGEFAALAGGAEVGLPNARPDRIFQPASMGRGGPSGKAALDMLGEQLQTAGVDARKSDAAARTAEAAAERARAAWQNASEKARAEWDKFYDGMKERGVDALRDMQEGTSKRVAAMAKAQADEILGRKAAENAMSAAMMADAEKLDAYEAGYAARADERLLRKIDLVGELGAAFQDLGSIVGGVFGSILSGLGSITGGISNAMASIRQMKTAGGGFGGMLGKASGALGLAGAAFSIGQTIWGGIKSLFGGKSAEEKAAEAQKIKDTVSQLSSLLEKAKALKLESLTRGVQGLGGMFGYLASQTGVSSERLERLGRFGSDLLARLRAEGMSTVQAFKAMGPALDAALEAWKKSGREMSGAFANVLEFRQKVLDNEGLVGAAEGFNDLVGGMPLNRDNIVDVQAELKALFDDMIGKGFTADQALQVLAPSLLRIRDAARDGKIAVDEATGALISQADTAGHFEGLKDPMAELVEVQKMMLELWAAIAKMQGVTLPESLRAYIAELNNARNAMPSLPGDAPAGKYENQDSGPEGSTQSAGGFWNPSMPHGPLAGGGTNLVVHPGEEVSVTPRGRKGGGMGNVVLNVDGRAFARVQNNNTRKNRGGARSQGQRFIGRAG